ncbi:hypothetical protein AALB64_11280 [Lachnospiraceae bacterium 45-P1]
MRLYEKHIATLQKALRQQDYYDSMKLLFEFDMWQTLPPAGRSFRGEIAVFLTKQSKAHLLTREVAEAVDYFDTMSREDYKQIRHWGAARRLIRLYRRAALVPEKLDAALTACCLENQMIWREALKASDFNMYRPHMKKLFQLKREVAQAVNPHLSPFQVMVDEFDEGLNIDDVTQLFDVLKKAIPTMIPQAKKRESKADTSLLSMIADRTSAERFLPDFMVKTGIDRTCCNFGNVLHPISYNIGPRDVRVTVNYEKNIWQLMCTFLHECGHARYQYGTDEELADFGLWGGISGAMHEGIARFYENIIGRSKEFIDFSYPYIVKEFPEVSSYSPEVVYDTLNIVSPGVRRMSADELTYSLHPIIRYEMEKDYFEGKISIDDFREIWNGKYQSYLGITPASDAQGVLQDISWSSGYLGYFQSYTLGNLYGAQILSALLKDVPKAFEEIKVGNFAPINSWMQEHIFRYGALYNASETIERISGKPLGTEDFLIYLRQKYCGE